ncbi:hypothetical protein CQY20_07885 [Mycolicibacterium agri]|uniref:Keratin associated protein n=1 Tax=Mycolicibacterium agri TaxID=36811 RepID=A0A2A7N8H5_MYCAG|nr:hypothetical protein [Mycolicibacterium agri]PEG40166.1 hypothetical protein CQY20_07885 [Mycolicibacterium agri]GFG55794.1 hypothetical protein MAGR_72350 [Mycolicibacterium agri]
MRIEIGSFTLLLASVGACAAIAVAPTAAAAPQCTNTGPNTTQCQTNGSAQIVTSPSVTNNYPYWGFPIISLGGFGFGW